MIRISEIVPSDIFPPYKVPNTHALKGNQNQQDSIFLCKINKIYEYNLNKKISYTLMLVNEE